MHRKQGLFLIYPEGGAYVLALPLIGSNSQCVVASNQNSMAERSLSLCKNPACSGLGSDWTEGWGREESKCEPTTTKHFEFVDDDLQELSEGFVPKNTTMSTKWALKNLQAWKDIRNPVPENLLKTILL